MCMKQEGINGGGPTLFSFSDEELIEELVKRVIKRATSDVKKKSPNSDPTWWLKSRCEELINGIAHDMRVLVRKE